MCDPAVLEASIRKSLSSNAHSFSSSKKREVRLGDTGVGDQILDGRRGLGDGCGGDKEGTVSLSLSYGYTCFFLL